MLYSRIKGDNRDDYTQFNNPLQSVLCPRDIFVFSSFGWHVQKKKKQSQQQHRDTSNLFVRIQNVMGDKFHVVTPRMHNAQREKFLLLMIINDYNYK